MSTAAVSSSSIYQELQAYFQQRGSDIQQLGQDLSSGKLASAQQDFSALQALGKTGPSANGDVFESSRREQDLTAVGEALQSGNLSAAQQAFAQLQGSVHQNWYRLPSPVSPALPVTTSTPTPASSIYQQLQAYRQQRSTDVQQLGQDLAAGNVANAQQDFNGLQTLGQSGPLRSGNTFGNSQREQDFAVIGQALQSGDLAGAQQAFGQLEATYQQYPTSPPISAPPSNSEGSTASTGSGTEIILNLANAPAGEQITIGLTNESNGTEQVSISATNPQNKTPEQVILNVNPNTNQQIVLNLFGDSAGSTTQGSSVNTTA